MGTRVSDMIEATSVEADDYLYIVSQVRSPTGSRRILPQNLMKSGSVLYVDSVSGSDTHGRRGSRLAFLTCAAAKTAAQSGDTIVVLPGTYRESNLLKNGVNWHFMSGAKVYRTQADSDTAPSIFDDSVNGANAAIVCDITGYGEFRVDDTLINNQGTALGDEENSLAAGLLMTIANSGSTINMQCKGFYSPTADCPAACFMIWIRDCAKVSIKGEEIVTMSAGQVGGILWNDGPLFTAFEKIECHHALGNGGTYALWASEPAAGSGGVDWYCRIGLIDCHYSALYFDGAFSTYKMWLECQEIRSNNFSDGSGINLAAIECLNEGKLYINAQKILTKGVGGSHLGPIVWQTGGEIWLTAQKFTAESTGDQDAPNGNGVPLFIRQVAGVSHYTVQHWEHVGSFIGDGVIVTAGTCELFGGTMNVNNGKGITHNGGTTRVNTMRIVTNATNAAGNSPVFVASSGLLLNQAILIAPVLAFSVDASAPRNVLSTTSWSNRPIDAANVSIIGAGLFTDDIGWV